MNQLISSRCLSELGSWIEYSRTVLNLPFKWNASMERPIRISRSRKRNLGLRCIVVVMSLHLVYMFGQMFHFFFWTELGQCVLKSGSNNSHHGKKCHKGYIILSWIVIYTQAYFWSVSVILNCYFNREEFADFLNALTTIGRSMDRENGNDFPSMVSRYWKIISPLKSNIEAIHAVVGNL